MQVFYEGIFRDAETAKTWIPILEEHLKNGLLVKAEDRYRLTERGTEVCDAILAEIV